MIALFNEMGPVNINSDDQLVNNPHTWNEEYAMLFIDNPVGVGYSKVTTSNRKVKFQEDVSEEDMFRSLYDYKNIIQPSSEHIVLSKRSFLQEDYSTSDHILGDAAFGDGYVQNQAAVAHDLYEFLEQFYGIFPEVLSRNLYITGESYAGKYVPACASYIHERNTREGKKIVIPLVGVIIGNGMIDPKSMVLTHAQQAFTMGLVSKRQAAKMQEYADQAHYWVGEADFANALSSRLEMFDYFKNVTGGINWYDLRLYGGSNWSRTNDFMNIHKSIFNIPDSRKFEKDPLVFKHLADDLMKSYAYLFPYLLDTAKIRVLLYQGNFDFRDGVYGSTEWIEGMDWSGAKGFEDAERYPVKQGWSRVYQNLTWDVIHAAGHLVPMDQGQASLEMVRRFVENL